MVAQSAESGDWPQFLTVIDSYGFVLDDKHVITVPTKAQGLTAAG